MSPRRSLLVPAGLAGAALLIAGVTALSRVLGFGRWLVFSETVTDSCLGTAYSTANLLPNIVFEVVAGGALASAVVPLLGAQLAPGRPRVGAPYGVGPAHLDGPRADAPRGARHGCWPAR